MNQLEFFPSWQERSSVRVRVDPPYREEAFHYDIATVCRVINLRRPIFGCVRLEFEVQRDNLVVSVHADVPHAETGEMTTVHASRGFPLTHLRMVSKGELLERILRMAHHQLYDLVRHEVDEHLRLKDAHAKNPHPEIVTRIPKHMETA